MPVATNIKNTVAKVAKISWVEFFIFPTIGSTTLSRNPALLIIAAKEYPQNTIRITLTIDFIPPRFNKDSTGADNSPEYTDELLKPFTTLLKPTANGNP